MSAWTAEQDARLEEMVKAGKSHSEIAAELGKSRNATLGRWHRILYKRGYIPNPRIRVADGMGPELARNTTPKRVYRPKIPAPAVASAGVGFVMPTLAIVPQQRGPAVGILDVTGCKWPMEEDASLAGGHAFCNAPRKDGKPYCVEHAKRARSTVPVSTWLKRAAA